MQIFTADDVWTEIYRKYDLKPRLGWKVIQTMDENKFLYSSIESLDETWGMVEDSPYRMHKKPVGFGTKIEKSKKKKKSLPIPYAFGFRNTDLEMTMKLAHDMYRLGKSQEEVGDYIARSFQRQFQRALLSPPVSRSPNRSMLEGPYTFLEGGLHSFSSGEKLAFERLVENLRREVKNSYATYLA